MYALAASSLTVTECHFQRPSEASQHHALFLLLSDAAWSTRCPDKPWRRQWDTAVLTAPCRSSDAEPGGGFPGGRGRGGGAVVGHASSRARAPAGGHLRDGGAGQQAAVCHAGAAQHRGVRTKLPLIEQECSKRVQIELLGMQEPCWVSRDQGTRQFDLQCPLSAIWAACYVRGKDMHAHIFHVFAAFMKCKCFFRLP